MTCYINGQEIFAIGDYDEYEVFLVMGCIELFTKDQRSFMIDISERKAEYAISNMKPRQFSAIAAKHDTCICWIHQKILNHVLKKHRIDLNQTSDSDLVPVNSFRNSLLNFQQS